MKKVIIALCLFFTPLGIAAEENLFYTYLGPNFKFTYNFVTYNNWFQTKQETKKITGPGGTAGLLLNIQVGNFIGNFTINGNYDYLKKSDLDITIAYLSASVTGQYQYPFTDLFSFGGGMGFLLNFPPSNRKYTGAYMLIQSGAQFKISSFFKIILNISANYGYFGLGENSHKWGLGVEVGTVFKVGHL